MTREEIKHNLLQVMAHLETLGKTYHMGNMADYDHDAVGNQDVYKAAKGLLGNIIESMGTDNPRSPSDLIGRQCKYREAGEGKFKYAGTYLGLILCSQQIGDKPAMSFQEHLILTDKGMLTTVNTQDIKFNQS